MAESGHMPGSGNIHTCSGECLGTGASGLHPREKGEGLFKNTREPRAL